jgi:hypothetical protein
VAQAGRTFLARHPNDGHTLAEPYRLGRIATLTLASIVRAMTPPAPAPRSEELLRRVMLGAQRLFQYMHPAVAAAIAIGLVVIDWLPVFSLRARFHRLDPRRASALLRGWSKSRLMPLRLLVMGLRSAVHSVYFDQDEVHRAIGYAPVPFIRERMALRRRLLAPVPAAAE